MDEFLKALDAEIKAANAQASIAEKVLEMRIKAAHAQQDVAKKWLENVAKFLDIKWDAQAHADLKRTIIVARQRARELDEQLDRLRQARGDLNYLLVGEIASERQITAAWAALISLIRYASVDVAGKLAMVQVTDEMKTADGWFDRVRPEQPGDQGSFVGFLAWARKKNATPKGDALSALRNVLEELRADATSEIERLNAELEEAEAAAKELAKIDWDRLS